MGGLDLPLRTEAPVTGAYYTDVRCQHVDIVVYKAIIPYVPTESPTLGHLVYEMILAYFLAHDRQVSRIVCQSENY